MMTMRLIAKGESCAPRAMTIWRRTRKCNHRATERTIHHRDL